VAEKFVSVRVTFGKPLPATVYFVEARQTVLESERTPLRAARGRLRTIPESFIEAARRHPCVCDGDMRTPI